VSLREVVDGILTPFVVFEAVRGVDGEIVDFVFAEANRAACEYNAMSYEDLIGTRLLDLLPGHTGSGLLVMYSQVVATGEPLVLHDFVYDQELRGGTPRRYDIQAVRIGDGLSYSWEDVTEQHQATAALAERQHYYRLLAENASDVVFVADHRLRVLWVSPSAQALVGRPPEDLIGVDSTTFVHPDDVARVSEALNVQDPERPLTVRLRMLLQDGSYRWISASGRAYLDAEGAVAGRVVAVRDAEEQVRLEVNLAERENRYRLLAENATDVVYENDLAGTIVWISPGVRDTLGWEPDELVGTASLDLIHPADRDAVLTLRQSILAGVSRAAPPLRYRTRSGTYRWVSVRTRPVTDTAGNTTGLVVGLRDVHEERAAQEELSFLAYHDPLTGLRNRAWILDILDTDLAIARRVDTQVALLFLDVDNFKVVNDSLGHAAGDDILVAIARRVALALRPGDRIGRFGGDEFIVIAPDIRHRHEVHAIAERLCAAVAGEVEVEGRTVMVSASIGITLSDAESTPTSMLRDADSALFRAKAAGRSRWEYFDPAMHTQAMTRLVTEAELRNAIKEHQFVVHYQPIVSLTDATVTGHEALVRWQHPQRGLIAPIEFLPIAEDSGLIVEIGDQVLHQVCETLTSRPDLPGRISVNKSPIQIARPGWHDRFLSTIHAHGIDPRRLVIEVTETAILSIIDHTKDDLSNLRDQGVGIHVDDFGTGYSSIALLRDLPVTGLKLDLSFTRHLTTDPTARALAAGLAGLVQGLNLDGIAEGIETPEQAEILLGQGWTHGQGYLYGRPGPLPAA
jgi:diguanylate cyclase (GGDEF)-like protein/PAS domain S-box-containing protein